MQQPVNIELTEINCFVWQQKYDYETEEERPDKVVKMNLWTTTIYKQRA